MGRGRSPPPLPAGETCASRCENKWGEECDKDCDCSGYGSCEQQTGKCLCRDGRTGGRCEEVCPQGRYGPGCGKECPGCGEGAGCDPVTGVCLSCPPGFRGHACEEACPKGLFGQDCAQKCACADAESCSNVDGSCDCPLGSTGAYCDQSEYSRTLRGPLQPALRASGAPTASTGAPTA